MHGVFWSDDASLQLFISTQLSDITIICFPPPLLHPPPAAGASSRTIHLFVSRQAVANSDNAVWGVKAFVLTTLLQVSSVTNHWFFWEESQHRTAHDAWAHGHGWCLSFTHNRKTCLAITSNTIVICVTSWPAVFSRPWHSVFQWSTECVAKRLLWSLCFVFSRRARGFLDPVLWYSFCLHQCHQKPPMHSQHYIGISLWENFLDHQTDTIIEVQVKSAPTMAALRVTVSVGLCSHPSTAKP